MVDNIPKDLKLSAAKINRVWSATVVTLFPEMFPGCLLYTSPSPRDGLLSRMPSSA